jgi:hypothetical protein
LSSNGLREVPSALSSLTGLTWLSLAGNNALDAAGLDEEDEEDDAIRWWRRRG